VGRTTEPHKRAALAEAAADYVMSRGFTGLSLRPLARALGTSARMLVYHFGSREALIRETLSVIRRREDARIKAWWAAGRQRSVPSFIRAYWKRLSSKPSEPILRLLFEVYGAAIRQPRGPLSEWVRSPVDYWQGLLARAPLAGNRAATATLILAATRGLQLDLLTSGDRRRTQRALELFLRLLEAQAPVTKRRT
jgi:AcrR family transcriptional regulator